MKNITIIKKKKKDFPRKLIAEDEYRSKNSRV